MVNPTEADPRWQTVPTRGRLLGAKLSILGCTGFVGRKQMTNEIKFFSVNLEAEAGCCTLSNAKKKQVYIAVECQNDRCDQRTLWHPSAYAPLLGEIRIMYARSCPR